MRLKGCLRMDRTAILTKAIERYGSSNQMIKAMEEMGELTRALSRQMTSESATEMLKARRGVVEELADVEIMLEQLKMIFDIKPAEIEKEKEFKLVRLNARIDDDCD